MVRLNSTGVKLAASLAALLVTLIIGSFIIRPLYADKLLSKAPLRSELLRAVLYDGSNPAHHYHLALNYFYDPLFRDFDAALSSYHRAIGLNPVNATYWLGLVSVFESTGYARAARSALKRALYLSPTYAKPRWMLVNQLLKEGGESKRVVFELGRIIRDFPQERARAFSLLYMVSRDDVELIVARALSNDLELMADYLDFLIAKGEGVELYWKAIESSGEKEIGLLSKYIDFLVSRGEIFKARKYFDDYLGRESAEIILNGGFEDALCSGGLCWSVRKIAGVESRVDESLSFEGRRSFKVSFDGTTNVNFYHVSTIVPLKPGHAYTLSASMMTEGLTTTNGLFLEIYARSECRFTARTEALTGSNPWQEVSVNFTAPPECRSAVLRFRRLRSNKLDSRIKGSARVDAVKLKEVGGRARGEMPEAEGPR